MHVENILQAKGNAVYTVTRNARVSEAVHVLNDKNIGVVVVVDENGGVTGILSERDIIRQMRDDNGAVMFLPVSKCMTADPVTCTPQSTLDELMQLMTRRRIRHVPVLDEGKLAGLVSIGDVVKRKIEETEEEAAALREYIAS